MSNLEATCRWQLGPAPPDPLVRALDDVHPVVLQVLARRGHDTAGDARSFLDREPGEDDPFRLSGVQAAVDRLLAAIAGGEKIIVYGDFDADGVTATAVLMETIDSLGGVAEAHIPHRARDGYGLKEDAVALLADDGADLIVTVDCGIRAAEEVAYAASRSVDVIVTDHHSVPEELPVAVAVVNPWQASCGYGFTGLSGVGLAYKLAQALLRSAPADGRSKQITEDQLLDLVAIGTVADVVPLIDENRSLVQRGVELMRTTTRVGLQALFAAADHDQHDLSSRDLAYVVGPRINAAGRMGHATAALDLLLATDRSEATRLAAALEASNTDRRAATETAQSAAEAALEGKTDAPFLSYAAENLPLGVIGLVAGRLSRQHYRPAAVIQIDGDEARGSARSIPEFDVVAALDRASDWLVRYGGHARAAGFTVKTEKLGQLIEHLTHSASDALSGVDLRPTLEIDAVAKPTDIGWSLYEALLRLEPFGEANPRPLLLLHDVAISGVRVVGGSHLRFVAEAGEEVGSIDAIAFGAGHRAHGLGSRADLVCSLRLNKWRGRRNLELLIEDMATPA